MDTGFFVCPSFLIENHQSVPTSPLEIILEGPKVLTTEVYASSMEET